MVAIVAPDEAECYLLAILDSPDGLDLAEFAWFDPESEDGCYRAWDFQWNWYTTNDMYQIDQGGRALGKTVGIKMRAFAFPFYYEGQSMLLTAPELNHLRPLTDTIEKALLTTRLMSEMLPDGKGRGIARQPHWQVRFKNGTSLVSRLPNKDGKGVKGQHVINIEMDECFPAGTLVLTNRGQVPIEDVLIGDQVLTHRNRWRRVTATAQREREVVKVRGHGHPGIECSVNHPFWVRQAGHVRHRYPSGSYGPKRVFLDPRFVNAVELAPAEGYSSDNKNREGAYYWASPIEFPDSKLPEMPNGVIINDDFWWLIGLYIAEGSVSPRGQLFLSLHEDEGPDVQERLRSVGLESSVYQCPGKGVNVSPIGNRQLNRWLVEQVGRTAREHQVPVWVLGQPEYVRRAVLDGYIYGDGNQHSDKRYASGRWQATTADKNVAISVKLLAQTLGYSVTLYWHDASNRKSIIRGREPGIGRGGWYQLLGSTSARTEVLEGQRYSQVRQVERLARTETLYDLTVDEDHSFVAEGLTVSNSQDYPLPGWIEIVETLNAGLPGAMWRCHGVSKGVRDKFFEKTQPDSGWIVHRPMAMHRPSWGNTERQSKIKEYGGSRQSIDYRRNIYGEHGDAANSVFVLARLMDRVDTDEGSVYNQDVYTCIKLEFERFPTSSTPDEKLAMLHSWIDLPGTHRSGYSQKIGQKEVGSPKGYTAFWAGMDVGVTNHPSELLVFGQRTGTDFLELLTRIQMHRIDTDDQKHVVTAVMDFYGDKIRLGIDKTGVGFPIWDQLTRMPYGDRIFGFGFSEKRVVAIEDRPLVGTETIRDLARYRNIIEASTDWLRNDYVDAKKVRLPYDREILIEFQGQTYTVVRDTGDPYGTKRLFAGGSFHTLDAAKIAIATKHVPPLEAILESRPSQASVLDAFVAM